MNTSVFITGRIIFISRKDINNLDLTVLNLVDIYNLKSVLFELNRVLGNTLKIRQTYSNSFSSVKLLKFKKIVKGNFNFICQVNLSLINILTEKVDYLKSILKQYGWSLVLKYSETYYAALLAEQQGRKSFEVRL